MVNELDIVARYAMALGFNVLPRTILVEGTTDVELFTLAARLERESSGRDLLEGLAIVAAGSGDRGGATGVVRELVALRGIGRACLLPNGNPLYRFIGLFDDDNAGKYAVKAAHGLDASILEYKDVFRLRPIMPLAGNLDPKTIEKSFERENECYKGLEWELEDLLSADFYNAFIVDYPNSVARHQAINGKVHRDLTRDGKARFHRYVLNNAIHCDMVSVIETLKVLRYYLGLP